MCALAVVWGSGFWLIYLGVRVQVFRITRKRSLDSALVAHYRGGTRPAEARERPALGPAVFGAGGPRRPGPRSIGDGQGDAPRSWRARQGRGRRRAVRRAAAVRGCGRLVGREGQRLGAGQRRLVTSPSADRVHLWRVPASRRAVASSARAVRSDHRRRPAVVEPHRKGFRGGRRCRLEGWCNSSVGAVAAGFGLGRGEIGSRQRHEPGFSRPDQARRAATGASTG